MIYGSEGLINTDFTINTNLDTDNLLWEEAYLLAANETGVLFDYKGSNENIKQEQLYLSKGMNPESSKHYAVFNVSLDLDNFFPNHYYYVSYLKLPAGYNLWWHRDFYYSFLNKFDIKNRNKNSISRTIINLNNWSLGQLFQVEDAIAVNWEKGDCYTFRENIWHGVGNFSLEDYLIMQITWIDKNDIL